ncbi:hypothetical protein ANN_26081 [Periplaneta americana]|uniref:Uncharacterized protein n=1 Tax=Periplaneta americana TaxID=6978 RepID=A0ABQ8S5G0_PERAM|nr:hypothetical protein ANN_26081 [Periplaneta americana]
MMSLEAILLEDFQESLSHCDKALETVALPVYDDFHKLWRSAAVESMDDLKIEEYLEKQGIRSMEDHGSKKPIPHKRKKPNQHKKPRDNEHLADVLETYDDKVYFITSRITDHPPSGCIEMERSSEEDINKILMEITKQC